MERIQPIQSLPDRRDPHGGRGYPPTPEAEGDEDVIDIRGLLHTIWRGKWIVAVCVLFAAVLGSLLTTQQPAVYRATAKVMFDSARANVQAGEDVVGSALQGGLQNQIEILRSTSLIVRVIDELGLQDDPRFNPALRPPPERWVDDWPVPPEVEDLLITVGLVAPPAPPPDPTVMTERLERVIVQNVLRGLQLRPVPDSQVIEIGYVAGDPRLAARIVNTVAEQYIVDQLEGKLETFRSATTWLTDRVSPAAGAGRDGRGRCAGGAGPHRRGRGAPASTPSASS